MSPPAMSTDATTSNTAFTQFEKDVTVYTDKSQSSKANRGRLNRQKLSA